MLACGDVEARLLYLVLYVAGAEAPLVGKYFGQYLLEGGDPMYAAEAVGGGAAIADVDKAVVGDVEGGAVLVARVFGGVAVEASQTAHVLTGA